MIDEPFVSMQILTGLREIERSQIYWWWVYAQIHIRLHKCSPPGFSSCAFISRRFVDVDCRTLVVRCEALRTVQVQFVGLFCADLQSGKPIVRNWFQWTDTRWPYVRFPNGSVKSAGYLGKFPSGSRIELLGVERNFRIRLVCSS